MLLSFLRACFIVCSLLYTSQLEADQKGGQSQNSPSQWGASSAKVTDLGELNRKADSIPVYPIVVSSSTPEIVQLANAAFRLHGGFRLTNDPNEAVFTFRFNRIGPNRVELAIESGRPAQLQFRQEVLSDDASKAILKACDLAVEKTLGLPGFFAGKLAFVSERGAWKEIFVGDLFFQKTQQITHDKHHSVLPHWSPDGRSLVYTGYYLSEFPDLFLVDLQTKRRRPFAAYQGTNTGAVYSPSGKQVAMILSSTGNAELYVADAQGKNPKRLTRTKALEASPTWSPDGRKLIFTSDRLGGPQLFEMNLIDRSTRRLPTNLSRYCAEGTWNPVYAPIIAFTAAVSKSFQIALFDYKEGKARFITQGPGDCLEPCWLNDGRHLIFTRRKNKTEQLFILDTWTGKEVPLHNPSFGHSCQASFVYTK